MVYRIRLKAFKVEKEKGLIKKRLLRRIYSMTRHLTGKIIVLIQVVLSVMLLITVYRSDMLPQKYFIALTAFWLSLQSSICCFNA